MVQLSFHGDRVMLVGSWLEEIAVTFYAKGRSSYLVVPLLELVMSLFPDSSGIVEVEKNEVKKEF